MNILSLENIFYSYEGSLLFDNLSLSIRQGEIATLIGASGSGKTTLFRMMTGLIRPHCGTVKVQGTQEKEGFRQIAYMMQDDLLLPWRNVLDNLLLPWELFPNGKSPSEARKEALFVLSEVGLEGSEEMFPDQLSGGMKQLVSLARALLQKRPILLLDEPFGALDASLKKQLSDLLHAVRNKYQTTILMITHDFHDAIALSERIFLLSNQTISRIWDISDDNRRNPHFTAALREELYQALIIDFSLDRARARLV